MTTQFCKISLGLYGGSHAGVQLMYSAGHFAINIYRNLQTSEACISKTSDLNAIKFDRVVNNAIVYNI